MTRNLERLGWCDFFAEQIAADAPQPVVARITEEQRGAYRVAGDFDGWAEISGKFRHDARATADFPAVGDWVCLTRPRHPNAAAALETPPAGERSGAKAPAFAQLDASLRRGRPADRAVITRRLNRRSTISRKAAGRVV